MERRQAYRGSANLHGLEHGVRIDLAGTSHVDLDRQQPGFRNIRCELPGDRPSGLPAGVTQLGLDRKRVHLHHEAVNAEVQVRPNARLHGVGMRVNLLQGRAPHVMRRCRNAPRRERGQQLALGPEWQRFRPGRCERIAEKTKRPARRDGGIELPQRSGSRVPRIGEHRFPGLHARIVQAFERVEGKVHFAPDLDEGRISAAAQRERNLANGAQVGGDVLANAAVPARGTGHQRSVPVRQAHRGAVDLEFHGITRFAHRVAGDSRRARTPLLDLIIGEGVAQRDHRHEVGVFRERRGRLGAHAQRWGIIRPQRRLGALDLLQLAEQHIVLVIRYRRTVEHVVVV